MEVSYPEALFATYGMTVVFGAVLAIEVLSLAFLLFASYEFRKMMARHAALFGSMSGESAQNGWERPAHVMLWVYIAATLAATAATVLLFVFQPHLL